MPVFEMRCSMCDKVFVLDEAPSGHKLAPRHTSVRSGPERNEVPCPGTDQALEPLDG